MKIITKDQILDEIRRASHETGEPLGQSRFSAETGIGRSEWGRYWARWGDALVEAWFAPNAFQAAYEVELLIEKLISLIRELGKFPTKAEITVKHHSDSGFPSYGLYSRIGGMSKLQASVVAYCRNREGMEDVISLCAGAAEVAKEGRSRAKEPADVVGFVYLLRSGRYYKIGKTNAVGRRERELAIQLPDRAQTVHSIRTDDPAGIEGYWHKRFELKRKQGEWFALDADDVRAFRRRKFM